MYYMCRVVLHVKLQEHLTTKMAVSETSLSQLPIVSSYRMHDMTNIRIVPVNTKICTQFYIDIALFLHNTDDKMCLSGQESNHVKWVSIYTLGPGT